MENLKYVINEEALKYLRDDTIGVQDKKNISLAMDAHERIYMYSQNGYTHFLGEKDLKSLSKVSLRIIKAVNLGFFFSAVLLMYFSALELIQYGKIQDYSNIWIFAGIYSLLYFWLILKYRKYAKQALNFIKETKNSQKLT